MSLLEVQDRPKDVLRKFLHHFGLDSGRAALGEWDEGPSYLLRDKVSRASFLLGAPNRVTPLWFFLPGWGGRHPDAGIYSVDDLDDDPGAQRFVIDDVRARLAARLAGAARPKSREESPRFLRDLHLIHPSWGDLGSTWDDQDFTACFIAAVDRSRVRLFVITSYLIESRHGPGLDYERYGHRVAEPTFAYWFWRMEATLDYLIDREREELLRLIARLKEADESHCSSVLALLSILALRDDEEPGAAGWVEPIALPQVLAPGGWEGLFAPLC